MYREKTKPERIMTNEGKPNANETGTRAQPMGYSIYYVRSTS